MNSLTEIRNMLKKKFFIRGLVVGEIIPIPALVEIDFKHLVKNEKHFVKETLVSEAWK